MRFFYVHPDDARWLSRWLWQNLLCMVAIVCFLLMIRLLTSAPATTINARPVVDFGDCEHQIQPPAFDDDGFRAVAPEGWRLTSAGWEDVSSWPALPRSLGEIVTSQRHSEPAWLQLTLAKLRDVPPLLFALMQLTLIAAIVNASKRDTWQPERATVLP